MSNITVGRILLLDLVFLVNSALTLVVFADCQGSCQ